MWEEEKEGAQLPSHHWPCVRLQIASAAFTPSTALLHLKGGSEPPFIRSAAVLNRPSGPLLVYPRTHLRVLRAGAGGSTRARAVCVRHRCVHLSPSITPWLTRFPQQCHLTSSSLSPALAPIPHCSMAQARDTPSLSVATAFPSRGVVPLGAALGPGWEWEERP
jgi:hypothetical protein